MKFNILIKYVICFTFLIYQSISLSGQTHVGFGIGANNYWGDLEPESLTKNIFLLSPAMQLAVKQGITKNINIRLNAHFGRVAGDDANSRSNRRRERNLSFTSGVREFALIAEYHLWDIESRNSTKWFSPFVGIGVGTFKFNPKTDYTFPDGRIVTIELQPLGTEGQGLSGFDEKYSLRAMSIPVIAGIKLKFSDSVTCTFEIMARYTNTDYLDDVSTSYVDAENFPSTPQGELASFLSNRIDEFLGLPENDPLAAPTSPDIRGSSDVNDFFHSGMITLYYRFSESPFGNGRRGGVDCYSF